MQKSNWSEKWTCL